VCLHPAQRRIDVPVRFLDEVEMLRERRLEAAERVRFTVGAQIEPQ
jgi:hypothetical protein